MLRKRIRVPATRVVQGKWEVYGFALDASVLDRITFVSKRKEDRERGYQRHFSEKRAQEIARYIDTDRGCLPTSILLNLEDAEWDEKHRTLSIPDKEDVAWVIDGQHRLFGLRLAQKKFPLFVTAFIGLSVEDQAVQFKTINSTQKGVASSLLYDLLDLTKDGTYTEQRGHDLAARLNTDPESPWFDQIDMIGSGRGLITQARVVSALESLISERGALFQYSEEEQFGILKNYFLAIRASLPSEWGNKKSVLTKAMGFSALLIILPQVLTRTLQGFSDFRVPSVRKVIKPLTSYDFSLGPHKGWAGHPGENRLAAALAAKLKQASDSASSLPAGIRL